MPVLRYWDGAAWVDLGGTGAAEVYVGNEAPVTRLSEVLWVDPDDASPGVIGQRWSPEFTLTTAQMAAQTQNPLLVMNHGLGAKGLILGHLEDGSWAHQCGWRGSIDTTQLTIAVFNHGPSPATAVLRFRVLY